MYLELFTLFVTAVLAGATVWLACSTRELAKSTIKMVDETREASIRQLGVQTWIYLASRFDSEEMRRARGRLSEKLEHYSQSKHDEITEEVLNVFEDIGTLKRLGLINEDLADSTFSYHVSRWWEVAKTYIYEERARNDNDNEIFEDFERLAKEMRRPSEKLDSLDLEKFRSDEQQLNR